jgi:hypothetical protein
MRTITQVFAAGESHRWAVVGSYFRLMEITAGNFADIRIMRMGSTRTEASQVDAGYSYKSPEDFDGIEIFCSTACTVKFAVSDGSGTYDRTVGSVAISGGVSMIRGAGLGNPAVVSVGTAAVQAVSANSATQALYFHAPVSNTGQICLGNSTVNTTNAVIRLNPGDVYIDDVMSAATWYAISNVAGQSVNVMRGNS